ncbi:hypothetical protein GCM10010435_44400 [Winogradskya consettensis]|uniref:Glycoside hydrolase family 5 domain-containing protein n=1 Tax=Winogradskya consettensis TaxID=113560 RepID=A0A919T391_9ACTN|nr:cellulase family glycosylhydrolase [Actinoplanes consettensis]GIM82692.1 hypothetical protein Aco04nite_82790 [Actinoplanes consettensis]
MVMRKLPTVRDSDGDLFDPGVIDLDEIADGANKKLLTPAERARIVATYGSAAQATKLNKDIAYRGVNLSGAEFGHWSTANATPSQWRWPLEQEWQYLASRGHKIFRLPYLWERIQPDLTQPNNAAQMTLLDQQISWAAKYGVKVVLDLHNYGGYKDVKFGAVGGPTEAQFASHWAEMANRYKDNETVIGHGLMNEPGSMPTSDIGDGRGSQTGQFRWYAFAQSAVNAIRATGDTTAIMVSGYAAGVVNSWLSNTAGVGNKEIHKYVVDPVLDNIVYEGHIYFDSNGSYPNTYASYNTASGQTDSPYADGIVKLQCTQLHAWLDWAQEKGVRVYLGEVGWPRIVGVTDAAGSAAWNALGDEYFKLLDGYGATAWASVWSTGSKWSAGYNLRYYLSGSDPDVLASPAENAAVVEAHPTFRARYEPRGRRPMSAIRQGLQWRGQNVAVETCTGASAMVAGQEFGTVAAIDNAGFLCRVVVYVGTAGATPTADQCFAALYDPDSGLELARTADIGSVLTTTGYRTLDMTTRTRVFRAGELVGVKLLWNGGTAPQILKAPMPVAAINSRKFGVVSTGATTLTSTMAINSMAIATQPFWAAVSGF